MIIVRIMATLFLSAGMLLIIAVVYSFVRTAGGTRYSLDFCEKDRCGEPGKFVKRKYHGLGHFLFRLEELSRNLYPLLLVYLFHTISPAFREKILITTSNSNSCPQ